MQPAATILIVKSGISNHAASGILDELCLSKFGQLPDTLRGLSKRGKTQHSMPDAARKNYLDFTPKNSPLPVAFRTMRFANFPAYSLSSAGYRRRRMLLDTTLTV